MKRSLLGVAAVLCLSVFGSHADADRGDRTDNAETTVAAALRGTWAVESFEVMGMKIDVPMAQRPTLTFDNGKAIMNDGMRREETTYKTNDSKTPKEIDINEPRNQGNQTIKGIYKIEGDTLKIAFSANGPGNARPTTFDAKDAGVMVLKRTK
jgi:uncharacterized protein (TIGR03067 family)